MFGFLQLAEVNADLRSVGEAGEVLVFLLACSDGAGGNRGNDASGGSGGGGLVTVLATIVAAGNIGDGVVDEDVRKRGGKLVWVVAEAEPELVEVCGGDRAGVLISSGGDGPGVTARPPTTTGARRHGRQQSRGGRVVVVVGRGKGGGGGGGSAGLGLRFKVVIAAIGGGGGGGAVGTIQGQR